MPVNRTLQISFLAGSILFVLLLSFASTFYLPWRSASFLMVVVSSVISIAAMSYYVIAFDEGVDRSWKFHIDARDSR